MREYMRKRYAEKTAECRAYKNSVKCKQVNNLPAEDLREYGKYLVEIHRLRRIKEKVPADLIQKILQEENAPANP